MGDFFKSTVAEFDRDTVYLAPYICLSIYGSVYFTQYYWFCILGSVYLTQYICSVYLDSIILHYCNSMTGIKSPCLQTWRNESQCSNHDSWQCASVIGFVRPSQCIVSSNVATSIVESLPLLYPFNSNTWWIHPVENGVCNGQIWIEISAPCAPLEGT